MTNFQQLTEQAQTDRKTMMVWHNAERTFRAAESHVFKDHQLTPTQFSVLETLYSKGDLRIQNLIDSILATSGNMTVVIRNMVRDGWIKRETDPDDRRACIVSLTEKGRKKIIEVLPDHIQNVQKVMSVFSEEEQKQLQSLLKKLKGSH